MPKNYKYLETHIFKSGKSIDETSAIIIEKPITLYVNGKSWLTFMCTPNELKELAVGFLFNEGIIQSRDEIKIVEIGEKKQHVDVWLNKNIEIPENWRRTSGCVGGYTSVILEEILPVPINEKIISPKKILNLFKILLQKQDAYKEAGGVHSTGLSNGESILFISEDVGRHNTLDKIAGKIVLENINISPKILLTTGRVSSEMIQKTARIKALAIVSRTSPTTLSIEIAKALGITLIGYTRGQRFTVYSHPENIDMGIVN